VPGHRAWHFGSAHPSLSRPNLPTLSSELVETRDHIEELQHRHGRVLGDSELSVDQLAGSRRVALCALMLLPGGIVAYFSFNSGGFFPAPPAFVAAVLCIVLAMRMILARNPVGGFSWRLSLALVPMALYTLEALLSQGWSHAEGVAVIEFDLPLVYLLVMTLFGSVPHRGGRLALMLRGLTVAIVGICACGLTTRLLPHVWPTSPDIANSRLSFPLTYWNALGLLAAMGMVLCVHFASDLRERWAIRVVAAGAIPVQACTLYFTFSRGGIGAAAIAVLVYSLLGRPRGLPSALLSAGPPSVVALIVAYDADLLATNNPTTTAAVGEGHHVAVIVGLCILWATLARAVLLAVDPVMRRLAIPLALRRHAWLGWACLGAALVIVALALHNQISNEYHRFLNPAPVNNADLRARLTDPGNDNRIPVWRVAWHGFQSAPMLGHGAGTFADTWAMHRPNSISVQDAHSLYLETLDELGILGLILLAGVILTIFWGIAIRMRRSRRPLYAAAFALVLAWALHAGIDWDWEMPAVTLVPFAVGGAALARRSPSGTAPRALSRSTPRGLGHYRRTRGRHVSFLGKRFDRWTRRSSWKPSRRHRFVLGVVCLLVAVAPTYVWLAQRKLDSANNAFNAGNCQKASVDARSSISILAINAQAFEVLGYCDVLSNRPILGLAEIKKAVSLDPNNYSYQVDLAVVRAASGLNPLSAARKALRMNPRDFTVQQVWQSLKSDQPSQWRSDGVQFVGEFTTL
jgi:O-antigen ligase